MGTDYLLKVARLYYQENMSQQEIADQLDISRVKVYRLLIKAKEEGIVKIEVCAPPQDFSELEIKIEKSFGIKQCIIVPNADSTDIMFSAFGEALSSVIDRSYKKGIRIGIGWGQTIRHTVEKIKFAKKYDMKIYPAIGGSGLLYDDIHANSIVSILTNKSGATGYILNCPAIMDSKASKEVFMQESVIKEIIDEFETLDLAIVPIGYIDSDITIHRTKHISAEDIEYLKNLNIIGDINSNFIDLNGNLVPNKIQDRIINVTLKSLKHIKTTVALCAGEKKVAAARAALKSGAVNILITDLSLAEKLL